MWNEFYVKRTIEKSAIHDSDLERFAIQKARELGRDNFTVSETFIATSNREYRISSRRTTEVVVKRKNNLTHSYTAQPITSADDQLLDKFFPIFQDKENEFGIRVQKDLIIPPNVVVRASKFGKSSDEKHRTF
ncbi:unnamed protein product [Rotaria socialis]|uniref:Uncharacterized protein n=2 Tax=Rotaria socialis TaxID=392032 RepID=A0A821UX92_9BILA|nr:unnamed protein product [Rotaria socialis]